MSFDIFGSVLPQLMQLRGLFDVESCSATIKCEEINNLLVDIKRSSHPTFKIFSATGAGTRIMGYMKTVLHEHSRKAMVIRRMEALSQQDRSVQTIANFDAELGRVGDDAVVTRFLPSFTQLLGTCIAHIAKHVLQVASSILAGEQSTSFKNCVPECMQEHVANLKILHGLKYIHKSPDCVQSQIMKALDLLTSAPLQLLLPEHEVSDIARLEELAGLLAGIQPYTCDDDVAFEPLGKLKALAINLDSVRGSSSAGPRCSPSRRANSSRRRWTW